MSYQVTVRLSISPCVKAEQGNPVEGIGYQKEAKELGTALSLNVRSPTNRPTYTTVTFMQRAYVSLMQAPWLSF